MSIDHATVGLAVATLAVGVALAVAATIVDARTHRLPNRIVGPLAIVGVVGLGLATVMRSPERLVDLPIGAVAFAGPWLLVHLASPSSIGFGDVKFSAALGVHLAWFDPLAGLWACAFALLAAWPHGAVFVVRRSDSTVPLGPYLLIGAIASVTLPTIT